MIHQMSRSITRSLIDNNIINFDDLPIYQYGLEVLLITLFQTMGILILALLTGYFFEAILFIIGFCTIRVYAGGYHASSVMKCFVYFTGLGAIAIILSKILVIDRSPLIIICMAILTFIIIYLYAPVSVINRPITEVERKRFRRISINMTFTYTFLIVVLSLMNQHLWYVGIFTFGIFLEAITLLVEKNREETIQ